ncbi:hypothetical protein ACFB49_06730 [Sphingomonas sp. DBB INV C78]
MIAATAHMSKKSIYDAFPSKMAIFEAAVRRTLEAAQKNLASVDPSGGIAETLAEYGLRLFRGFLDPASFGLFRANIVAANQIPELADDLHALRLAMSRNVADYLMALQADLRLVADIDPLSAAIRFGGLAVGGSRYFLGTPLPGREVQAVMVRAAIDLFLNGYGRQITEDAGDSLSILDTVAEPALEGTAALRLSPDKLDRLIDAAMIEFFDKGYPGASVDRIAIAVGASKATIYRQFGSKEGLFRFIIRRVIFLSSRAHFVADLACDVDEAVAALARQALDWHLEPWNISMHRLLIQESDLVPDLAEQYHDVRVAVLGRALHRLLAAHGWPRPDASATRSFYALATFAVRFLTVQQMPADEQRGQFSREGARLFLRGYAVI